MGLKELTEGRRARARAKLELEASEASARSAHGRRQNSNRVTEGDISREIAKVDGARKVEFGQLEEGKLDFARAQIQYEVGGVRTRFIDYMSGALHGEHSD